MKVEMKEEVQWDIDRNRDDSFELGNDRFDF